MGYYSDPIKRADYFYDKAQKFFLEYGGENLRLFCTRERVSYVKMLDVLGWTSVPQREQNRPRKTIIRKTQPALSATGLRPLIIDGYRAQDVSISITKEHKPC